MEEGIYVSLEANKRTNVLGYFVQTPAPISRWDGITVTGPATYEYKISAGNSTVISTKTVSNVPVKKNYNTNIVGNLMTEDVSFNITIDEAYAGDNNQGI